MGCRLTVQWEVVNLLMRWQSCNKYSGGWLNKLECLTQSLAPHNLHSWLAYMSIHYTPSTDLHHVLYLVKSLCLATRPPTFSPYNELTGKKWTTCAQGHSTLFSEVGPVLHGFGWPYHFLYTGNIQAWEFSHYQLGNQGTTTDFPKVNITSEAQKGPESRHCKDHRVSFKHL